jgi:DeoR/GlpR family transcriptional regulator of sugar metabolism
VLAKQRQERILETVRDRGAARIGELAGLLGVSDMTVRRDLDTLARDGLLEKVHGGASVIERAADEPGFAAKSMRELPEKEAMAAAAAALVTPGTAVAVTAGTTTWTLARHLGQIPSLTVVTNSIPVADVMWRTGRSDLNVVLTGGLRTPSDALVGPVTSATIRSLHVDLLFMGVHGMAEHGGFSTPNLMEAEVNRAFVASARRLVVVADHTKWGVTGLSTMAELDEADVLVTDDGLGGGPRRLLEQRIGDVIVVSTHATGPLPTDGDATGSATGEAQP